jgi:mannose-1-phosphate guanylyltransferase/phosphomannomutase
LPLLGFGNMKAVVLAGGQEFGQSPLSRQTPRALWPLLDRPILEHVLEQLRRAGIGQMAISANGRTHDIKDRLGLHPSPDITVHYSEDPLPRGVAGCLKDCQKWLGDDTFIVVSGACLLLGLDFEHLVDEHRRSGAALTLAADAEGEDAPAGRLPQALKPTGIYVCEPAILSHVKPRGYQDMKEQLIPRLIAARLGVRPAPIRGCVIPLRNEECYLNALLRLLDDEETRVTLTGHLVGPGPGIWIHPTAQIDPTARIVGPVYVGPDAKVSADSVIIGPAVIGARCEVGADATVHESVLWPGACVGAGATVEQTVMASDAVVGAGAGVRGAIVIESSLSAAERLNLSGSMALTSGAERSPEPDGPVNGNGGSSRWWTRVWSMM